MADDILGGIISEQLARERGTARVSAFTPEMAASRARQVSDIAKRYNLAPPVVDAQFDTLQKQNRADKAEAAFTQVPALRQSVAQRPDTVRMIPTSDFDRLANIGRQLLGPSAAIPSAVVSAASSLFSKPKPAAAPTKANSDDYIRAGLGAGIINTLATLPWALQQAMDNTVPGMLLKAVSDQKTDRGAADFRASRPLEQAAEHLFKQGEKISEGVDKELRDRYDPLEYLTTDFSNSALTSPARIMRDLAHTLPSTVALLGTARFAMLARNAAVTRATAAGAAPAEAAAIGVKAAVKTGAVTSAVSEGVVSAALSDLQTRSSVNVMSPEDLEKTPEYAELRAAGFEPEAARAYIATAAGRQASLSAAATTSFVSFFGGGVLGRIIGEGGSLVGRTFKGFLTESVTEGLQSPLEQIGANAATRTWIDPAQSLWEGAGEAAAAGAFLGGLMGGGATAVFGRKVKELDREAGDMAEAVINHGVLEDVMEAAAGVELRQNAPVAFAQLMQEASTRVSHVYVPIEVVDAALADEALPDEEKAALTLYQEQFDDARASVNGDVVIPIGEAMANFHAGTKFWQSYGEDTRVVAGGASMREARMNRETMLQRVNQIGEEVFAATEEAGATVEAKTKVFNEVQTMMTAAGRGKQEATSIAAIWASYAENRASDRYAVNGQRQTIEEAWADIKLEIQAREQGKRTATPPNIPTPAPSPADTTATRAADLKAREKEAALQATRDQITRLRKQEGRDRPEVKSVKQRRDPVNGTRHEVTLSDGTTVSLYRDTDQFGTSNPQWYVEDPLSTEDSTPGSGTGSLGSTKAEALEAVAAAVERGRNRTLAVPPQTFQQSVTLRSGKETLKKFGLDPNGRYNTREVAAALEARQRAKWGKIDRDDRSPEAATKIAKWMVEEVLFEMQHPEQSGVGWYSEKFQRAVDVFAAEFEELATDQDARDLLTSLIAITSDGQKVVPNFAQAIDLYANFRKTGKFTTDRGHQRQESIDNNIAKIQQMYDEGNAAQMREDLLKEDTVSNLKKRAKELGLEFSTSYQAHIKLPLAAVVFGPKLGAFYANLMGAHGYLTMDRWWSRTFNRYRGTLLMAPTAQGLARFKELVTADQSLNEPPEMMSDDRALTLLKPYRDSYAAKGYKNGTEIEKAANTLYKAAFENLEDQPFSAKDRTFMLETVNKAHQMLQKKGAGMSVADIQAVLWYYEKRLYGELGAGKTADVSYEEAARIVIANRRDQPGGPAASEGLDGDPSSPAIRVGEEDFLSPTGLAEDENGFPLEDGLISSQGDGNLDPTTMYQFGGLGAALMHPDDRLYTEMNRAIDMEQGGADRATIWKETGWIRQEDGHWRFEIDDSNADLKLDLAEMSEEFDPNDITPGIDYLDSDPRMAMPNGNLVFGKWLPDVLDHPELFEAYPHLRTFPVFSHQMEGNVNGYFAGNLIAINPALAPEDQRSTLFHEIQHAIQLYEGFTGGASTVVKTLEDMGLGAEYEATVQKLKKVMAAPEAASWTSAGTMPAYTEEQIRATAAYDTYMRVLGEVEARLVQDREFLTAEERRIQVPALNTEKQIGTRPILIPSVAISSLPASAMSQEPVGVRGQVTFQPDGRNVIELFRTADFSTMIHETSHTFLQQEFLLAQREGASEELKADVEKLKAWMTKHGGSFDENGLPDRTSHELFARTGERYFREGKAPSAELKGVFKQYKEWLESIYETIGHLLKAGPAPITDEIREIMDRMLASRDAINELKQGPMSQTELGMTDAEYAAYRTAVDGTHDKAHDTLLNRMMKAIRDREKDRYKRQRQNVRDEVLDRVNSEPRFVALHLLRTNRWLNDPERPGLPVHPRINTGWLIENYGEEVLAQLPNGTLQPLHRGDGMVGDLIAEMVGETSGDALVKALLNIKTEQDALEASTGSKKRLRDHIVDQETDRIMGERHGDIAMSEEQIREEAIAALNSAAQGEVLAMELRQLQKKNRDPNAITPYALLREWARRKVSQSTVKEAKSRATLQRYTRNYAKATRLLEKALLANDGPESIKQKQAQMVNHAALAEAKKTLDQVNVILRRMNRYAKTKALGSIDQDYMDRIHELINAYGFDAPTVAPDQTLFREWAAQQAAEEHFEVHVPDGFENDRDHHDKVSVEKLLELNDMVQSLVVLGKAKQKLSTAHDDRRRQEIIDDIRARTLNLPERKLPTESMGDEPSRTRKALSELVTVENFADQVDGTNDATGPLNRTLIRPATDATNRFAQIWEEVMAPIAARLNAMTRKQSKRMRDQITISELTHSVGIDEADTRIGDPVKVSRKKLLGMIANTGNLSNLYKMVGGEKYMYQGRVLNPESAIDLETMRSVLLSYASREDMDFVQDMWDGIGKLWPYIVEVERELTGIVPEKVVSTEFEHEGKIYRGGYWPVVWDSQRSEMGARTTEEQEASLLGVGPQVGTPKGHTITRTGAMAPMEYRLDRVINGHMTKVVSRIAYGPWVRDALRVINNPSVKRAINLRMGPEYTRQLKLWIRDQIPSNMTDHDAASFWASLADQTRINMSIAVLGLSWTTGVAQLLGLSYSAGILSQDGSVASGFKWMGVGMGESLRLNKYLGGGGAQAFVFARSPEMSRRAQEMNREVVDVLNKLKDKDNLYTKAQALGFAHIAFIDMNMVAIPTWLGAYKKAQSQGMEEADAIAYAEKVVRKSQGSGRKKDLAAIQRGGALNKFVTTFYTPSGVFFNQQWKAAQDIKAGNWGKAMAPTFYFLVLTSIMNAIREGDYPEDDDEDDLDLQDYVEWAGRNIAFESVYGIPYARDAANAGERILRGEYAEFGNTPLTSVINAIVQGGIVGWKGIVEEEELEGKDLAKIVNAIGFGVGLPSNQPGKTGGFAYDVYTGRVEPEGVMDWYKGLTSGKVEETE